MAENTRPPATTHRCVLHDDYERKTVCSGTLKKGRNCVYNATVTSASGLMPTCKIHREQQKVASRCRAPLPCGFECGRLFEWEPYGIQFCADHRKELNICYFLKIPVEMRLRVYRFLLPDKPIPARYENSSLTTNGERVYTAILRVNKLIHAEATHLLYRTTFFTIEVSGNWMTMCNLTTKFIPRKFLRPTQHSLQDHQMQPMLLGEMARQEQDDLNGESNHACGPTEILWHPPLNDRCFNMIQSFRIELVLRIGTYPSATIGKIVESRLYDNCDSLHGLIGTLQLIQMPIARLEIIIKFGHTYIQWEEALSAAQILLGPFRRLYNVAKPNVLSVTMKDSDEFEIELLTTADTIFTDYLKSWSRDLSSSQPSYECPQILEAYWKLEKLVTGIKKQCYVEPMFDRYPDLLHAARIAREAHDPTRFREICDEVVKIWGIYLNGLKDFQSYVGRSIYTIHDIVRPRY